MSGDTVAQVTAIVSRLAEAGPNGSEASSSTEELLPLVYDELRRLAQAYLARERNNHTLQATALVHEAYLRLVDQSQTTWQGRNQFFAAGARVMRQLLVDHARRRGREKRGGGWQRVTLDEAVDPVRGRVLDPDEVLALNDALEKLERLDERQARFVELRFFAGLKVGEIATLLGVSKRTAEGAWSHARAWLKRELAHRKTE